MHRLKHPATALLTLAGVKNLWATPVAAVAATVSSQSLNADPIPWALGAVGATVVYSYRREVSTRFQALVNSVVSIFCGGVVAPYLGAAVAKQWGLQWQNDYVFALALSALWPWLLLALWNRAGGKPNA